MKKKYINLYCPMHGTQLYNEEEVDQIAGGRGEIRQATCNHENCEHKVMIEDTQNYDQEGVITIALS